MADKLPDLNVSKPKSLATDKKSSNVSYKHLTTEERAEESGETGYSSAQQSSDLLSGAEGPSESPVCYSEDHGPGDAKSRESSLVKNQQKRSPGKPVESEIKTAERSPERTSIITSHTPPKESAKGSEECSPGSPYKLASSEKTPPNVEGTPTKGKSPKRSFIQKLKSPRKKKGSTARTTGSDQSPCSPEVKSRPEGSEDASSSPKSAKGSPKVEPRKDSSELEASPKSSESPKRRGLLKIGRSKSSPSRQRSTSTESESLDIGGVRPKFSKEKSPKRASKDVTMKTKSPLKRESTSAHTKKSSGKELPQSGMKQSIAMTCDLVSSGIQNIQLSLKAGDDTIPLLQSPESTCSTDSNDRKEKVAVVSTSGQGEEWKPQNKLQEGGFCYETIWATFESSADETGTEMSTVSDSSAIKGGSESKKGGSSSCDTISDVSGFKEEVATEAEESTGKLHLQRQKRLKSKDSSGSDEDSKAYRAIQGSASKKAATHRKSTGDSSEE